MNVFEVLERGRAAAVEAARAGRDAQAGQGDVPPVAVAVRELSTMVRSERLAAAQRVVKTYLLFEAISDSRARAEQQAGNEGGTASYARVEPRDLARDELAAALDKPTRGAGFLVDFSVFVVERAPAVLEAMYLGRLDETRARAICTRLGAVEDRDRCRELAHRIVNEYLGEVERGTRFGSLGMDVFVDDIIADVEPEAVAERREKAREKRSVSTSPAGDGMVRLRATLPAEQAAILRERLGVMARKAAFAGGSVRATTAMEADALFALAMGCAGTCRQTHSVPGSPATYQVIERAVLRPQITVIVGGSAETEVYVRHLGRTSLDTLSAILGQSLGSTIYTTGTDRLESAGESAEKYRISADLARRIRLRDGACRHPGCSVPADRCDIDHLVPFDRDRPWLGGLTTEDNLVCMCRHHHRLKTHGRRKYEMEPDGELGVETDFGQRVRSEPCGPLARARKIKRGRQPAPAYEPQSPPSDTMPDSAGELIEELRERYRAKSDMRRRAAEAEKERERRIPRPEFLYEGDVEIVRSSAENRGP